MTRSRISAAPLSRLALALLLAVAALISSGPERATGQERARFEETGSGGMQRAAGELVVAYRPGGSEAGIEAANRARGARTLDSIPQIGARVLSFPEIKGIEDPGERARELERIKRLYERDPLVDVVDYNYARRTGQEEVVGDFGGGGPWGTQKIEAPAAWNASTGSGATVAVVDTGVDASHPALAGKVVGQRDLFNGDNLAEDEVGHGTHVAGIIAAGSGGEGAIGVCPDCGILAAKVAGAEGITFDSAAARGIVWSADEGADVINVSLVSAGYSRVLERAVEYAWNSGAVVVSAAGNEGSETPMYPSAYGTAVAVSATDRDDRLAGFSNYGEWVDVAAPGRQILSTFPGGRYGYLDGTSMSSAFVSGLAGLLAAQGLAAPEIRQRIEFTAAELGTPGHDPYYGWGRIDARSATGALPPAPEISGVRAPAGTPGATLTVSVSGSGFQDGARVLLAQGREFIGASYVEVESPERLIASLPIPATASGVWDALVVNPDGQRAGYLGAVGIQAAERRSGPGERTPNAARDQYDERYRAPAAPEVNER